MNLSIFELDLLNEALDKLYAQSYEDYKVNNSPYNFSRVIDIEQLRKKICEERQK